MVRLKTESFGPTMDFPVCIANIAPSTSCSSCSSCNITAKTCPITPNTRGDLPGRQISRCQLKRKLLRYIRNYCGAIELAGPNSLRYRPVLTIFEALWGKRKQHRSIVIFGFGTNLDRLQPQKPFRWGKQCRLQYLLLRIQGLNGEQTGPLRGDR